MTNRYNYEVMFDDKSIDVSKEVSLVWSIANSLRGAYTSDKYKDVIIPMVIIRRFECALAEKKDAVVAKYKTNWYTLGREGCSRGARESCSRRI